MSEKPKPERSKTSWAATAKEDKDLTNLFIRFPLCEAQPIHQHRTTLWIYYNILKPTDCSGVILWVTLFVIPLRKFPFPCIMKTQIPAAPESPETRVEKVFENRFWT